MDNSISLKLGDSVRVKKGETWESYDEDISIDIGGWQGRIIKIIKSEDGSILSVRIKWDSITLKNMPVSFIKQSEWDGFDYSINELFFWNIELVKCRDVEEDVSKVLEDMSASYPRITTKICASCLQELYEDDFKCPKCHKSKFSVAKKIRNDMSTYDIPESAEQKNYNPDPAVSTG
jgi:predicted RNA-binding Zn-ribbon protein involved in translation (DUF1610 family)